MNMRVVYDLASMVAVGIIGASGYTGAELLRLIAGHPQFEVVYATGDTQAGSRLPTLYPSLALAYPELRLRVVRPRPGRRARPRLPRAPARGISGDRGRSCRARSAASSISRPHSGSRMPSLYPTWYGFTTTSRSCSRRRSTDCPSCTGRSWTAPQLVATPGCYVTAASLAIAPLVQQGLIERDGRHRRRCVRGLRCGAGTEARLAVLHGRRGLQRLRPARPSPHARDRTGHRARRCCSPPTWRR